MTEKVVHRNTSKSVLKLTFDDNDLLKMLLGERDSNLKITEKKIGAHIHVRGNQVTISGDENEADLKVVGWTPHKKKEGWIGSLILESECGKILVSTGSGMDDDDRQKDPEYYMDNIVAIKFNEIIDSDIKDTWSLFLPIYLGVRYDKDTADTMEEIIKRNKIKWK